MDIAGLRREYTKDGLDRENLDENPYRQFKLWFDQACRVEILEPNAMTLGTADSVGRVYQRTVLMKAYDETGIVFYTNYNSSKSQQISQNPNVSLLFPWLDLERQVIFNGVAKKVSMAESLKYFAKRPRGNQIGAWVSIQSQVISSRRILEMKLDEIKRKFQDGKVPLPDFWGGYRINPRTIEFWQGGESRLHDRFLYTRDENDHWKIDRLSP